ncbi:Uncharacterised protein [Chromobacterium violaceum]|uniref:Uncharacterized protein n=1 Tax=Chromobacterium violaceum TaxID=536 RepID=A0A3S4JV93_CHRVL|nr:Uncharacterised protein [Chromobacterium violaceum]
MAVPYRPSIQVVSCLDQPDEPEREAVEAIA